MMNAKTLLIASLAAAPSLCFTTRTTRHIPFQQAQHPSTGLHGTPTRSLLDNWRGSTKRAEVAVSCAILTAALLLGPSTVLAADFSNQDLSGRDLSGKDFTGVIAKNTNFQKCNLENSQFVRANLVNADFSGANVQKASFEGSLLDGASFKDAKAQKAVFSETILDVGNFENVDLSDSLWPSKLDKQTRSCFSFISFNSTGKLRIMICDIKELKGVNPETGADSRGSIFCDD